MGVDERLVSPWVTNNRQPIREVLLRHVRRGASILEIASGSGEHGVYMVSAEAGYHWTYSDVDEAYLRSQAAWREAESSPHLHGPLVLDTSNSGWVETAAEFGPFDAVFCANMIHIAPVEAMKGLIEGAGRLLSSGGQLVLYGPFARHGEMSESNKGFDQSLKDRNPQWGVRDLDETILPLARASRFSLSAVEMMPANNLSVVFLRS